LANFQGVTDSECPEPSTQSPARQWIAPDDAALTKAICLGSDTEKTVTIGAQLGEK
jgi:hypothetical protein